MANPTRNVAVQVGDGQAAIVSLAGDAGHIYVGEMIGRDTDGWYRKMDDARKLELAGIALQEIDVPVGSSNGAKTIQVLTPRLFTVKVDQAYRNWTGRPMYAKYSDEATFNIKKVHYGNPIGTCWRYVSYTRVEVATWFQGESTDERQERDLMTFDGKLAEVLVANNSWNNVITMVVPAGKRFVIKRMGVKWHGAPPAPYHTNIYIQAINLTTNAEIVRTHLPWYEFPDPVVAEIAAGNILCVRVRNQAGGAVTLEGAWAALYAVDEISSSSSSTSSSRSSSTSSSSQSSSSSSSSSTSSSSQSSSTSSSTSSSSKSSSTSSSSRSSSNVFHPSSASSSKSSSSSYASAGGPQ